MLYVGVVKCPDIHAQNVVSKVPVNLRYSFLAPQTTCSCINLSVNCRSCDITEGTREPLLELSGCSYQHADFNTANDLLCEVNWEELLTGDVNEMWAAWEERFMSVMCQCIPSTKLSRKQNIPWINKDITKAIRARNLSF